jgi:hypothetical protein
MKRICRYEVPIDGKAHTIRMTGSHMDLPIAVRNSSRIREFVGFWAEDVIGAPLIDRVFRVYVTGYDIIPDAEHWVGTAPRTSEGLVFHLYEIPVSVASESETVPDEGNVVR